MLKGFETTLLEQQHYRQSERMALVVERKSGRIKAKHSASPSEPSLQTESKDSVQSSPSSPPDEIFSASQTSSRNSVDLDKHLFVQMDKTLTPPLSPRRNRRLATLDLSLKRIEHGLTSIQMAYAGLRSVFSPNPQRATGGIPRG